MRLLRTFAVLTALALSTLCTLQARADDDDFDVAVASGQVTVTAHSGWHISKDYPWRLVAGDLKLDKSKFTLAETTATVSGAPQGKATLKGAICSGDRCHNFQKDLTIQ
jgi:hypothetical protein